MLDALKGEEDMKTYLDDAAPSRAGRLTSRLRLKEGPWPESEDEDTSSAD